VLAVFAFRNFGVIVLCRWDWPVRYWILSRSETCQLSQSRFHLPLNICLVLVKLPSRTNDFFCLITTRDSFPSSSPISDSGEHSPFVNGCCSVTKPGDTILDKNLVHCCFETRVFQVKGRETTRDSRSTKLPNACHVDTEIEIQEIHWETRDLINTRVTI